MLTENVMQVIDYTVITISVIVFLLLFLTKRATTLIISGIILFVLGTGSYVLFLFAEGDSFGYAVAGFTMISIAYIVAKIVVIVGAIKINKT
ncbi:hypothetical protein [Geomicrobium sp. JCM 19038]|uniref:hypothetical protein n=1 Tax=Geomicrobium sp. JCM 19038 TaxID=1460635 RepID=UPI00045F1C74|nr:hypothetical protein [Geomicrobium sp. JCM 19038]GAK07624.1 hypothetical protein JCM19038_1365 [Geomicrobium sp. JCM 19038]